MTELESLTILAAHVKKLLPKKCVFLGVKQLGMDDSRREVHAECCFADEENGYIMEFQPAGLAYSRIRYANLNFNATSCFLALSHSNKGLIAFLWGGNRERPCEAERYGRVYDAGAVSVLVISFKMLQLGDQEGSRGPCIG